MQFHAGLSYRNLMVLNEPPAADLLDLLAARSDGNPYFVEQMVIYLRDRALLDGGGLTAQLADGDILLPRDTRALLVALFRDSSLALYSAQYSCSLLSCACSLSWRVRALA